MHQKEAALDTFNVSPGGTQIAQQPVALVVDDDDFTRTLVANLVQSLGLEVCGSAATVNDAMKLAIRHGGATSARVSITAAESSVSIKIEDDGSGISTNGRARAPGLGSSLLNNLTNQWQLIDSSTLGPAGATLEVTLPLSPVT